jgi:transcriptional regulator with XRE-family HTH domain
MSRLGTTVRKLREEQSLSMQELAAKTNLRAEYIRRLEQGKELPSKRQIETIARELKTNPENLLARTPKLDENLVVYLNSNPQVVELLKASASASLKKEEVDGLRKLIEEQKFNLSYVLNTGVSQETNRFQKQRKKEKVK